MPGPVHRDHARSFLIGIVAVVVIGAIAWVGATVQVGGELPAKAYTYVRAAFADVGTLTPRQEVAEDGGRIGQVDRVDYQGGLAIVTMRLDGDRAVYRDATASIANASALGRKRVELDPGTPGAGPLGDTLIDQSHTRSSISLDDVFAPFDAPTRSALQSSLNQLAGGVAGHGQDLHDVLTVAPELLNDFGTTTGALASRDANLPHLLDSADQLAGQFDGHEAQLRGLLSEMDATLQAVNVDGARPLTETVTGLPATLRQARDSLRSLDQPLADVRAAVTTAAPGARALGASTDDLRGLFREAVDPLRKVPGVGGQALPAVDELAHTFADARPVVPRIAETVTPANVFLTQLAPYSTDIGRFFSEHDLLSGSFTPDQHFFSATLAIPSLYNVSLPDPTAKRIPYPAPGGGAWRDNPATGGAR